MSRHKNCVATQKLCRDTKIMSRHRNCFTTGSCNGCAPARAVARTIRIRLRLSARGQARQGTVATKRLCCNRRLMLLCRDRELSVTTELISSKKKKVQNFNPQELGCHIMCHRPLTKTTPFASVLGELGSPVTNCSHGLWVDIDKRPPIPSFKV